MYVHRTRDFHSDPEEIKHSARVCVSFDSLPRTKFFLSVSKPFLRQNQSPKKITKLSV